MSRQFGETVPDLVGGQAGPTNQGANSLLPWIAQNEVGRDTVIETPFGKRQMLYCDYSASARAIGPIEDYLKEEVLPFYGNTHSSVTVTAEQTTLFVHEARQEVRSMTCAGDGDDVIFTGSGTTAAVELLVHLMDTTDLVVIHSLQEHHSNLLPWRQVASHVYCVKEDEYGRIDIADVSRLLTEVRASHPSSRVLCAFTACSNLTGVVMDVEAINTLVQSFGALSVWDYASAAPYVEMNVNGSAPIDAVFFSGHKFIGGVATPGVLVIKKALIQTTIPKRIGGGTVFYVNEGGEWYLKEAEYREEGGTADAIGIIRLALAIKLKRSVTENTIRDREQEITSRFLNGIVSSPNIYLLGPKTIRKRLPVFSFIIKDPRSGLFFHHNYISALMNDLFGIQSRAGCMCAGPYAQHLLGINQELSLSLLNALRESDGLDRTHLRRVGEYSQHEILRPGFTRVSIPYFWTDAQVDLLVVALKFISEHASDFIHLYQLNCESAEWHHHKQRTFHARKWLGHVSFTSNGLRVEKKGRKADSSALVPHKEALKEALILAEQSRKSRGTVAVPDGRLAIDSRFADLRWFLLPIEVVEGEHGKTTNQKPPFSPREYSEVLEDIDKPQKTSIPVLRKPVHGENEPEEASDTPIDQLSTDVAGSNSNQDCDPCSVKGSSTMECPLDPADTGKGRMGDLGTDEKPEEVQEMDDWNRRVIVTSRVVSKEEEMAQPWFEPPLELYKKVTEAIHGMEMIKDGDRILVCLSGGKDSLALLHILHFYQKRCRKNKSTSFELGAITVDPGSSAYNPRPLIDYCRSLNLDYFYEEQDIIGAARKMENLRSICAFCSRMKRGRLAAAAQLHGWNVLAMGQHLDDLAESFFIAAFQNGNLSTMKAQYTTRDGALRVIRPLVFVRERSLRQFAESNGLPVVAENCPACFNQATERHRVKQLLAQQELVFPDLFHSLRGALRPLLLVDSASTDQMRALAIENIVKQNKGKAKMNSYS